MPSSVVVVYIRGAVLDMAAYEHLEDERRVRENVQAVAHVGKPPEHPAWQRSIAGN